MSAVLFIITGILLLYVLLIIALSLGLLRADPPARGNWSALVPVTLIVPFRNELDNLHALVPDLMVQTFPDDLLEVIFVNDHSEDGSDEWLREQIKNQGKFRCFDLPPGKEGKKTAISLAMQHASGVWIIQTDADCRLGRNFVAAHLSCRQDTGADLIAGMVTTDNRGSGMLEILERLDVLSLTGAGAGSFHLGRPLMCSGANLSYSRQLYFDTRSFEPGRGIASGDDMFLMIGARKLDRKLVSLTSRDALVKTSPAPDLNSLIAQRIRWGSKAGLYRQADIQGVALLVLLANLSILIMPWMILLNPLNWQWLLPGFIARCLADFTFLYFITGYTDQRRDLLYFFPVIMLYYPYQGLVLAGSLFWKGRWKGRWKSR